MSARTKAAASGSDDVEDDSAVDMDPALAKRLWEEGSFLIFTDVPPRTQFGVDLMSWHVGEDFLGLKMIPPGLHFISYSAVNKEGNVAPRTGFFHFFKRREVLFRAWDEKMEDIKEVAPTTGPQPDADEPTVKRKLQEYDSRLGAYPYPMWKKWMSLTNFVTENVVRRLEPLNQKISSVCPLIPTQPTIFRRKRTAEGAVVTQEKRSAGKAEERGSSTSSVPPPPPTEESLLPEMTAIPGTQFRFTALPSRLAPPPSMEATPSSLPQQQSTEQQQAQKEAASALTKHCMDATAKVEQMIAQMSSPQELLAELQFSFVCFLVGHVYDAFEHWKALLNLLCSCDDFMLRDSNFFMQLITVLHFQILHVPEDLFVDIVSSQNFLYMALQNFFSNIEQEPAIDSSLATKARRFKEHLSRKFEWDFEDDDEECMPVVVELETSSVSGG